MDLFIKVSFKIFIYCQFDQAIRVRVALFILLKPKIFVRGNVNVDTHILMYFSRLPFKLIKIWLYGIVSTLLPLSSD